MAYNRPSAPMRAQLSACRFAAIWLGLVLLIAMLAGCNDERPKPLPPVEVRTITVDRMVPVPCVKTSDIPAEPPKVGNRLTGDAGHDLDIIAPSAARLRTALETALALFVACTVNGSAPHG